MGIGKLSHLYTNETNWSTLRFACFALLTAWSATFASVAQGQALARGTGVEQRVRPEYEAQGLRLGSFVAFPAAEVRFGYDDNVLSTDKNEKDDAVFTLAPSFLVESDWTRHYLSFESGSSVVYFADQTDEQRADWNVAGNGRIDLFGSSDLTSSIRFQNLTEDRGSIDSIRIVREPTEYDQLDANLTWNQRFNRFSVAAGSTFTRFNFFDAPRVGGGMLDEDFRDRNVVSGATQLGYEFMPGQSAFLRGTVNDRDYRKSTPAVDFDRDSFGYEIVTGWNSGLTNLITGEVYVGYLDQDYESSALRDIDGVSFGMDLDWFVTELTTLSGTISRRVVESTTPGAGGILVSTGSIGVVHELMRNILLDGGLVYEQSDYEGTSRNDDWVRGELGVKYLMNRYLQLDLEYSIQNRASNVSTLDFLRNQVSLGFRGQF